MISYHISDDIPPQMKVLNMVIPLLMHFGSFILILTVKSCVKPLTKRDVIHDVNLKLVLTVYDILSQILDVIQSDVALQKQVH